MQVHLIDINVFAEIDEYHAFLRYYKKKKNSDADGHMDGRTDERTDNVKKVYHPQTKFGV